jgi:hypothetical protein
MADLLQVLGFQVREQVGVGVPAVEGVDGGGHDRSQDNFALLDLNIELSAGLKLQSLPYGFGDDQLSPGRKACEHGVHLLQFGSYFLSDIVRRMERSVKF